MTSFTEVIRYQHFQQVTYMASLGFTVPPLDTKVPGPPLIYLVGFLAISDPTSIFVYDPLTLALL